MKSSNIKKLAIAAVLCAVGVIGGQFTVDVFGSKPAPVQHMINVFCAVLLGPAYGVGTAFVTSLLRNLMGRGTLMAFPGSMIGALLAGFAYKLTKNRNVNIVLALIAEVFGTGVLGGLCAYPVSIFLMGNDAGSTAFYAYIIPFLISTVAGSIVSGIIVFALDRAKVLPQIQKSLE